MKINIKSVLSLWFIVMIIITECFAAEKTIEEYINDLQSEDIKVVDRAIEHFCESDESYNNKIISYLSKTLLNHKKAIVRGHAANILACRRDKSGIQPLVTALKDENARVRSNAAMALGYIARNVNTNEFRIATPVLIKALQDNNNWVRANAAISLGYIKDKESVQKLIELLKDKDKYVKMGTINALGHFNDKSIVPVLFEVLKDKDGDVRANPSYIEPYGITGTWVHMDWR